jgi:hypothetical protein
MLIETAATGGPIRRGGIFMNPRILGILMIALIATALASPARAAPLRRSAASDRQAIIALENQWIDAKDASTLERVLADDFMHPVYTGDIINKRENIEWLMKHPRPANRHARFASMEIRLFGDVAQAYGAVSVSDDSGSEVSRFMFTDVFVYRRSEWQAVSAEETVVLAEAHSPGR